MHTSRKDTRKDTTMDQLKISKQLKAITLSIAVFGLAIYALIIAGSFNIQRDTPSFGATHIAILTITLIICYDVLYQFWKVCTQIGLENSFSYENVKAFIKMSYALKILAGMWLGYSIARIFIFNLNELFDIIRPFVITAVWGIISALAGALSKLIEKARQIREENDLTI